MTIGRDALVAAIMTFLAGQDAHTLDGIRDSLEHEIDEAGPDALVYLGERLANAGADWRSPAPRRCSPSETTRCIRSGS